jgi:putative membrane protein
VSTLPAPELSGLFAQWSVQPVALVVVVLLAAWYARSVLRLRAYSVTWPAGRTATFALGLALLAWTTCGFLQAYASSLYWVWTTQALTLLLVAPLLLLAGQPLRLARLVHADRHGAGRTPADRFVASPAGRIFSNPLVGPALIPLLSFALFFGPLAGWAIQARALGWCLQLLLVAAGGLIVLPLVDVDADPSSLAVGLMLAIGSFELVLDAIPGIALRLHTSLVTGYFDHRAARPWSLRPLHDQQVAGAILWIVAELIDLPFLLLVYRRWLRADARDAAAADAVLEAERAARSGLPGADPADADAPWWLSDPVMRDRLRRRPD